MHNLLDFYTFLLVAALAVVSSTAFYEKREEVKNAFSRTYDTLCRVNSLRGRRRDGGGAE